MMTALMMEMTAMPQIVRQHTAVRMPRTTVESGNASASAPVPPQMTPRTYHTRKNAVPDQVSMMVAP